MSDLTDQQTAMLTEGICPHCQTELQKVAGVLEWVCGSSKAHRFQFVITGNLTAGWCRCKDCGHNWFGEYDPQQRNIICPVCVGDAYVMGDV